MNSSRMLILASNLPFATKDGVNQLDQERLAIMNWLTPTDYSMVQSDFISRRQQGTGQWFLDSAEFRQWVNNRSKTLFCPGIPGAGKTMIMSIVIDHLHTEFQNNAKVGIAYIYCNPLRRQQEQTAVEVFSSLLKQLIQGVPFVPENIKKHYEHHHKRTRPLFSEISKALQSTIANYSRTLVIIDGLDRYLTVYRKQLLVDLVELQAKTGANLLLTSRLIPEIGRDFEGSMSLEIHATDQDLNTYLDSRLAHIWTLDVPRNLENQIRTSIIDAADGM